MSAGDWSSNTVLVVEDLGQQHLSARILAAALRRAGLGRAGWSASAAARMAGAASTGAIIALAAKLRPRLIIFSVLFADRVPEQLVLIAALRRTGVDAHVALTGPLPSFAPAELLAACPALDSVLCGEAEASVAALAASLDDPAGWRGVPGLAFREAGSLRVCTNPWPAAVAELDDLPWPQRDSSRDVLPGPRVRHRAEQSRLLSCVRPVPAMRLLPGSVRRQLPAARHTPPGGRNRGASSPGDSAIPVR